MWMALEGQQKAYELRRWRCQHATLSSPREVGSLKSDVEHVQARRFGG